MSSKSEMEPASSPARQWHQLIVLSLTHAVTDIFVGMIAPVIVPMRDRYGLSLGMLIFVTSLLGFSANIFQIPIGCLRARWRDSRLICLGAMLAATAVFIPNLPPGAARVTLMSAIAVLSGLGVAVVHPEGLRALHGLDAISASLSTAIFMVAGFMGFAGGALLSATLTAHFGLESLKWVYLAAPVSAAALWLSGLRLPLDTETNQPAESPETHDNIPVVPFVPVFIMATVLATCSQIQATLLPSYLHDEAGLPLPFSGLSFTLFGIGGTIGAITWGALAPRIGHLRVLLFSSFAGAPLTALYLLLAPRSQAAAALLAFTGFIVYTGFPLCITLARYASSSLRFGQRMGIISGGTWGIAAVVLWILGPLAEKTGMGPLLHLIWVGYLATGFLTVVVIRRQRHV
jgi:FSR family fosmidomycin resistance protein-like MFS transporter